MATPDLTGSTPVAPPEPLPYEVVQALYDRRTLAAHEVMGDRWQRFVAAKEELLSLPPGSREWHAAAERAYRLGLRSTHAYYLWTSGHTALALETLGAAPADADLQLRLSRELQSLRVPAAPSRVRRSGDGGAVAGETKTTTDRDEIRH